ncbi:hypothetical protein DFH09DRAFT_1081920 [Mycena vulgaris]|nr:hypothetical protein DFH09DRAFT_1081920 [Mycena vulgaris]
MNGEAWEHPRVLTCGSRKSGLQQRRCQRIQTSQNIVTSSDMLWSIQIDQDTHYPRNDTKKTNASVRPDLGESDPSTLSTVHSGAQALGLLTVTIHDGYTGSVIRHPYCPVGPLRLSFDGTETVLYGCRKSKQMGRNSSEMNGKLRRIFVIRWSSRKSPISSIHGFAFDPNVHASGFLALGAPLSLLLFIHPLHVPVDEPLDYTFFLWTTVSPERCARILYPEAPRETLGTVQELSAYVHCLFTAPTIL